MKVKIEAADPDILSIFHFHFQASSLDLKQTMTQKSKMIKRENAKLESQHCPSKITLSFGFTIQSLKVEEMMYHLIYCL